MEDEPEITDNEIRKISLLELQSCLSAKETLLKEHSDAYKWLMASLLAINAGGLLKIADFSSIGQTKSLTAASAFLVGILAALAIAWLGQIATRRMLEPLAEIVAFWSLASVSGQFDEAEFKELGAKIQSATNTAFRNRWTGWVSVGAFCIGIATIASGPVQEPAKAINDCDAKVVDETVSEP